jgi:hypothetical protein
LFFYSETSSAATDEEDVDSKAIDISISGRSEEDDDSDITPNDVDNDNVAEDDASP